MNTTYNLQFLYKRLSELHRLECIRGLLSWDQRVCMPPMGAQARADQLEYLAVTSHEKATDPELARVIDELYEVKDSLSIEDQVNVRETKRTLDIKRKLPEEFVSELTQARVLSYTVWEKARPADDFQATQPHLEKLVELCRRRAEFIGYQEHPYDALLDIYEPGLKLSIVKPVLMELADELRKIIPSISEKFGEQEELQGQFPQESQARLCKKVAESLGFSFESGRIDTTAHPFSAGVGPKDHRITTRYNETDFLSALYGTIHETGHALYDLGLPVEYAGTPMGEPVSLSIHESQSRMWENLVGRSREFTEYLSPTLKELFPQQATSLDPDNLWRYANLVRPSLIRTEADEVTYSQHIVIRMLLEVELIEGGLKVVDLPTAWSDLYEKYLGVRPSDYKNGIMQDVHWFSGSIGYFPTYALGNLYGAMMLESAKESLPDMPQQIRTGQFAPLLGWLRENVHRHGMAYRGPELIRNITGRDLSVGPFVDYLKNKFGV